MSATTAGDQQFAYSSLLLSHSEKRNHSKRLYDMCHSFSAALAVICLIVALARPQTRNDQELVSGEGIDIILCMDVSGSMLAQDFTPNRLEAMKQVAADFVDQRPTDRIGLVIFAGESFTSSPITMDKTTLKTQILNAQTGYLADGTAIGDGLATSVERLKESKTKTQNCDFAD